MNGIIAVDQVTRDYLKEKELKTTTSLEVMTMQNILQNMFMMFPK